MSLRNLSEFFLQSMGMVDTKEKERMEKFARKHGMTEEEARQWITDLGFDKKKKKKKKKSSSPY